jgi:hypothetical protein
LEGEKLEKSSSKLAQVQFELDEERNKIPYHKQTWTGEDDLREVERPRPVAAVAVEIQPVVEIIEMEEEDCDPDASLCLEDEEDDKENTGDVSLNVDKEDAEMIEKALNTSSDGSHKVVNIDRSRVKDVNECKQQ